MSITLCVVLITPATVLLVLIVIVAIRPDTSAALAEVLHASAEPLRAIAPWRRSPEELTRDSEANESTNQADEGFPDPDHIGSLERDVRGDIL